MAWLSSWITSALGSICSIQMTAVALAPAARRPGARPRRRSPACPREPAHSTSWAAGSNRAAARSRCWTPFWRVIRPTNTTDGRPGRRRSRASTSVPGSRRVLVGVDPVVDDLHAARGRSPGSRRGCRRASLRHRDHGVGRLERRLLGQARDRVAAAELLGLPRPQRLEAVDRGHVRDAVHELGEVPAEVRVPGVAVDDLGVRASAPPSCRSIESAPRAPRATAPRRRARPTAWWGTSPAPQACTVSPRRVAARARGTRRGRRRRRRRQAGTRGSAARPSDRRPRPWGSRRRPPADTVKRSRSASGSTPISAPGRDPDVLVDDRVADHRAAADVDAVEQDRVLDLGVGVQVDARRQDRPPRDPAREHDARADHRVERVPAPAVLVEHELGRRQRIRPGVDRPSVVVEVEHRVTPRSGPCARRSRRRACRRRASSRGHDRWRPAPRWRAKSYTRAVPAPHQHRDEVAADVVLDDSVRGVRRRPRRSARRCVNT